MKYFTGKDYPQLCEVCQRQISTVASFASELPDEYAGDEEGPISYVYDYGLYCGGRDCVNSQEEKLMDEHVEFSELFMDNIAGARYVYPVKERNMLIVWYGGFTIHGIGPCGQTVCAWGIDSVENLTLEEVMDNITEHVENEEFPY